MGLAQTLQRALGDSIVFKQHLTLSPRGGGILPPYILSDGVISKGGVFKLLPWQPIG